MLNINNLLIFYEKYLRVIILTKMSFQMINFNMQKIFHRSEMANLLVLDTNISI